MEADVIVWHLEIVPDLRGFAAANDLDGKSDNEMRLRADPRSLDSEEKI